jgi:hypothetical protein
MRLVALMSVILLYQVLIYPDVGTLLLFLILTQSLILAQQALRLFQGHRL